MAQRQYMRKIRTGSARFEDVYRAVSEYREKYDKAVIYSAQKYPELGWASLMAGGSCAVIPVKDKTFLSSISSMKPEKMEEYYLLKSAEGMVVYLPQNGGQDITLPSKDTYILHQIDERTGQIRRIGNIKKDVKLKEKGIFWLQKK